MINLDQVRTLEWKVKQAVQLIAHLRRENDTLRGRLSDTEVRLQELESLLEAFKATQNEMETGIRSALEELDNLDTPVADQAPVDPVTYPPEVSAPAVEVEPEVVAAPVPVLTEVDGAASVATEPDPAPSSPSFEEEFAALAAEEEAARLASLVPDSIELEEGPSPEEADLFDAPAPQPTPEESKPEQPGLGIF